jgi:hypothetical protein
VEGVSKMLILEGSKHGNKNRKRINYHILFVKIGSIHLLSSACAKASTRYTERRKIKKEVRKVGHTGEGVSLPVQYIPTTDQIIG